MYFMFDIGGTFTRIASSKTGRTIDRKMVHPTPKTFSGGMQLLKRAIDDLGYTGKVVRAACGVAGPLDRDKTKLVNSPNLRGWVGKPLKKTLEKITRSDVLLENDTALVGLGEAHYGAGKGYKILGYITISTGVGGVRIVDGAIDKSAMGFEIGHQIVNPDDPLRKTIESIISGTAITKKYKKQPSEIENLKIWKGIADWVAVCIANSIVYWSPHAIILGGGVSNELKHYFPYIKKKLRRELTIFPKYPAIKKASLRSSGGLYGALVLIKNQK